MNNKLILMILTMSLMILNLVSALDINQANNGVIIEPPRACYNATDFILLDGSNLPFQGADFDMGTASISNIGGLYPASHLSYSIGTTGNAWNNIVVDTYENSTGQQFSFDSICTSTNGLCSTGSVTINESNLVHINGTETITGNKIFNSSLNISNGINLNGGNMTIPNTSIYSSINIPSVFWDSGDTQTSFNGINFYDNHVGSGGSAKIWYERDSALGSRLTQNGLHINASIQTIIENTLTLRSSTGIGRDFKFGFGSNPADVTVPAIPDFFISAVTSGTSNRMNITFGCNEGAGGIGYGCKTIIWDLTKRAGGIEYIINSRNMNNSFFINGTGFVGIGGRNSNSRFTVNGDTNVTVNLILGGNLTGTGTYNQLTGMLNVTSINGIQAQNYSSADGTQGFTGTCTILGLTSITVKQGLITGCT